MDFANGEVIYETPTEFVLFNVDVSADGSRLAFGGRSGQNPNQVYTVDLPDGDPQPVGLPGANAQILSSIMLDMSEDGSTILYNCLGTSDEGSIDSTCLWKDGTASDLDPDGDIAGSSAAELTPDGSIAAVRNSNLIYELDVGATSWTEVYDYDNPPMAGYPNATAQGGVSISDDGEVIAFSGNDESGEDVLRAVVVMGPGTEMGLANDPVEFAARGGGISLSPDGTRVAWNNTGRLKWFDIGNEDTLNTIDGEVFNSPFFVNDDAIAHYFVDDETEDFEVRYSEIGEETVVIASGPDGAEDIAGDTFQMAQ